MFEVKGTGLQGGHRLRQKHLRRRRLRRLARRFVARGARARRAVDSSASAWYSGPLSTEMPWAIISRFFGGDQSRIRALGRYSGEQGLKGVYRLAIKFGSPAWVVGRLSIVFGSYFRPGEAILVVNEPHHVVAALRGFPDRRHHGACLLRLHRGGARAQRRQGDPRQPVEERERGPRRRSGRHPLGLRPIRTRSRNRSTGRRRPRACR